MSERFRFLEPQALMGLRHLRLAAQRVVEGAFAGRHRSRLRGSSVEFADYREYTPGDDLRRLDWKALVRLGRPYLRTYDDETNLRCVFVLDASASMDFGARVSKLDYARFLLAATAYLVASSRDQAGLAVGADRLDAYLEPRAGRANLDRLLHALEQIRPRPRTDLAAILNDLFPRLGRRSLLMVYSDFLEPDLDRVFQALRIYRHRGSEVVLVHVLDPVERQLPQGRAFRFRDSEGPGAVDASPDEIRAAYRARLEAFLADVRRRAAAAGCAYERVETDMPYPEALRRFLRSREGGGG